MAEAGTPEKKDMLMAQGAHEIRNPAAVILGYVRMLLSDRMGPLTETQRRVVGEIEKSTARLAELAHEMSFLARLLEGGARFARASVDLGALIAQEIPAVPVALDREIPIRLIDEAPGFKVSADAKRLRDAFNWLMFSHRRELDSGREVWVAIDRVAAASPPAVRVSIGAAEHLEALRGLAESELEPLVEFRGGLGYKLSIARKVIEAHDGRIFSKTEPGGSPEAAPLILGAVVILPES
jgi:signal transduction histidine kinase